MSSPAPSSPPPRRVRRPIPRGNATSGQSMNGQREAKLRRMAILFSLLLLALTAWLVLTHTNPF